MRRCSDCGTSTPKACPPPPAGWTLVSALALIASKAPVEARTSRLAAKKSASKASGYHLVSLRESLSPRAVGILEAVADELTDRQDDFRINFCEIVQIDQVRGKPPEMACSSISSL